MKTDVAGLLKEIMSISNKVEESMSIFDSIDEMQRRCFLYRQSDEDDNITHTEVQKYNRDYETYGNWHI